MSCFVLARHALPAALLFACAPAPVDDDDDDDPDEGFACTEEIPGLSFRITGTVEDASGRPVTGAQLELVDVLATPPRAFGAATTASDGAFDLRAEGLTAWPDCWNVKTDHRLRAEATAGSADVAMNRLLSDATRADEKRITLDDPVVLDE